MLARQMPAIEFTSPGGSVQVGNADGEAAGGDGEAAGGNGEAVAPSDNRHRLRVRTATENRSRSRSACPFPSDGNVFLEKDLARCFKVNDHNGTIEPAGNVNNLLGDVDGLIFFIKKEAISNVANAKEAYYMRCREAKNCGRKAKLLKKADDR